MGSFLPALQLPTARQVSPNHGGLKQQVLILLHGFSKPGIQKQLGWAVLVQVSHVAWVEVIWKATSCSLGLGRHVQLRAGTAGLLGCTFYLSLVSVQSLSNRMASEQPDFLRGGQGTRAGVLRQSKPGGGHITFHDLSLEVLLSLLSKILLLRAVMGSSPS